MSKETKHSPEPWAENEAGDIINARGETVVFSYEMAGWDRGRAVAAVNSVAGISTAALEFGALAKALEALTEIGQRPPEGECDPDCNCNATRARRALHALGRTP